MIIYLQQTSKCFEFLKTIKFVLKEITRKYTIILLLKRVLSYLYLLTVYKVKVIFLINDLRENEIMFPVFMKLGVMEIMRSFD